MTRALVMLLLSGCTIVIIRPNQRQQHQAPPDPDGDDCPIEAREDRPTVDLLVWVRSNRGLTTLAPFLEERILRIRDALSASGQTVAHLLVQSLDGTVLYVSSCEGTTSGVLQDRLAHAPEDATTGCPVDAGNARADQLKLQETPIGTAFFTYPPTRTLVVWLDHDDRQLCTTIQASALAYPNGTLEQRDVRHLVVTTPELTESLADMNARCAALPRFPLPVLDVMTPASTVAYTPFVAVAQGRAVALDYCDFLSETSDGFIDAAMQQWWQ